MEGDRGGRLAAHFCINLQIDSIRRKETGEGGRQAVKDDKAPRAGHSTLSKPFLRRLLDEWSALLACIPFAGTRFGFTGAYSALYLTSPLSSSLTCGEMDRTSQTSRKKKDYGDLKWTLRFDQQHLQQDEALAETMRRIENLFWN